MCKNRPKLDDIDFHIGVVRWLMVFGPMFDKKLNVDALKKKMDDLLDLRYECNTNDG
jgi:hypothetical protein